MAKYTSSTMMMWFIILVLVGVVDRPIAEGAIACFTVVNDLNPCLSYVMYGGMGGPPAADCCNGVRSLYNRARDTPDIRAVCSCLNSIANSATPVIINNAARIPPKCGISSPFPITPSVDCSRVR